MSARRTAAGIAAFVLALAGCARPAPEAPGAVRVVAAFYPLAFAAERVAGDLAAVDNLTPPGAEPHDLELSPRQVAALKSASLVLYLGGGFQPSVDAALPGAAGEVIDVLGAGVEPDAAGVEPVAAGAEPAADPHVWLDPARMGAIVVATGNALARIDPPNADAYLARSRQLHSELIALGEEFRAGLAGCKKRTIVTSHEAFGHLARAYGLQQVGIAGMDPEQEPSPQRLAEVAGFVRKNRVSTIYFETLLSPALAETIARETGAATARLDPLESGPEGGDYFSAMRENLAALRKGLACP